MTRIFDEIPRSLSGGKTDVVSDFDYLNNSDRPESQRVRDLMESHLSRYPSVYRDVIPVFSSGVKVSFRARLTR